MKISYDWLKDLVETDLTAQEVAEKLTKSGSAVEGIEEENGDFIFDFDLTSNRGDCFSHLGLARELAANTSCKLRIANHEDQNPTTENHNLVIIEDADLCHRFTGRIIRNVKIAPSPEWLVKRLEGVGERSINNVADITNYVMLELGNPMHAFDLNKLTENRIIVRRARNDETIKTLDEVERKLDESMLAICDAEKPVAIAGIMGGFDSSITDETTDVFLEVAYFDRDSIRQTSRKLKLSTEASHRFERGVDIENLIRASNRATELICELAGGEAGEFADIYPTKHQPKKIESADIQAEVKRLTGLEIELQEILNILDKLGIAHEKQPRITNHHSQIFTSPSWRHDINIEADLVEEVARIIGYDKIGDELPPAFGAGEYQPTEQRKKQLRQTLAGMGFDEAISYSFIDTKHDETFDFVANLLDENANGKFISLQDSIIEGATRMRASLLSGLLDAVRTNFNQQKKDVKLFEIGKVFAANSSQSAVHSPQSDEKLPIEREFFAIALTGSETAENRATAVRELDFYDAKGALEIALNAVNSAPLKFLARDVKHLRKGQSAEISANGKSIGTIGRLNDEIAQNYKFRQPVFIAEIDLQSVLAEKQPQIFYQPLPKYPAVVRDVSLLVKRSLAFAQIKQILEKQNFELLKQIEFVDIYEGKGLNDDERSLTVRLVYRSGERTLTEDDVEAVHQKILVFLESELGVKLRF